MQNHIQTLVKQFFQRNSLEEVPIHEVQRFAEEFPYSAAGQILYAKKLRQTGEVSSKAQVKKSALYFHNPVWSRWILQPPPAAIEQIVEPVLTEPEPEPNHPIITKEETHREQPLQEEPHVANLETLVASNGNKTGEEAVRAEIPAETPVISDQGAAALEQPVPAVEEDPPFEPYHTIDYFASQGIKLRLEDLPKDKLGQQLKSFTDWLRSMKKINPATEKSSLDDITHQAIQQIAEHSVAGREIITEAMAEVWAKQGHREKATAIYQKLSLLNPAKSAYFADKIEQLKAV
jgi:hypothetical protein